MSLLAKRQLRYSGDPPKDPCERHSSSKAAQVFEDVIPSVNVCTVPQAAVDVVEMDDST